jgi:putative redox protein
MSRLPPELGSFFAKMVQDLASQPGEKLTTNRAVAFLQENQRLEVTVRGFTLVQDEPTSVMGGGKGPAPTDFFISSVALCENVVFARNAALSDLAIDSLETTAEGIWNMNGLYEIEEADSAFRSVKVETRVRTTGPVSEVVKVARLTHRRCPIYATLRKSLDLAFKLTVNGVKVPLDSVGRES